MKSFLFFVFFVFFCFTIYAQTYTVTVTPATCPANGSVTIQVTDPPPGSITYTLVNPAGEETPAQVSNSFSDLQAGIYTARVYLSTLIIYEESVEVKAQYVATPPRITSISQTPAYSCSGQPAGNTGSVSLNVSVSEGSFPLQVYLYSGSTYNGSNILINQTPIPSGRSNANFSGLASGSYCIVLTDACNRSVIQNNITISAQNISYSISVSNASSVQAFLKVDTNCQNYLLDPLQNMNINTTGFSSSTLQYSIEWPANTFTEYRGYNDRIQLSLPLDYTTWDTTLKIYFKNPCDPSNTIGPYTMRLYTPGSTGTYPDVLPVDVLIRELPDRDMCDVSGRAYILPFMSQSNNTRTCFPVTVTVTSSDDPNFGGPKIYTWTSFNQNDYPSVSTTDPSLKGIVVTAGYNYQCVFKDNKAVYPQTATSTRFINPSQYGVKPKITVIPVEDPRNLGKGRFYIVPTDFLASGPYPVTIQSISGPTGYTPFSVTVNQKPTANVILTTNQPMGDYQIRITAGSCRDEVVSVTLNNYIPLPDNTLLNANPSTICNSFNLQVVSSFANSPQPLTFNTNFVNVAFSQVPTGSSIIRGNYTLLNYNSTSRSFSSNINSTLNQPSGTYVFQLYYQDYVSGLSYIPLLSSPITRIIENQIPTIDMANSGGTICQGNTTGTLVVTVTGGSANQKKYAIKQSGSSTYGPEQTSNQFTGLPAGKYMVRVNDGCNIVEQELEVISVAEGNIIIGPDALCTNEAGLLATIPVGPVNSITWTLPDQSTKTGPTVPVLHSSPGTYLYKVNILTKSGCNFSYQKNIQITPDKSTWVGTTSGAWNDPANWDNLLVPGKCTFVTIPAGAPNYPELTQDINATCDSILFQFGGEVAKTNYLAYNGAKVELTLHGQQWHMLASPLYYMYSGDFWIAPFGVQEGSPEYTRVNPKVFMRQYQPASILLDGIQVTANNWTTAYNDMDIELQAGKGYSTWVSVAAADTRTLYFPRPETRYEYFVSDGSSDAPTNIWTPELTKKNGIYHSHKLAYDKDAPARMAIYNDIETIPTVLIGNPFMSHLDVAALAANNPEISGTYYVWSGVAFDAIMTFNQVSTLNFEETEVPVAPMQSFVVEKSSTTKIESLNITPEMSVTSPGNTLRNIVDKPNLFQIEVQKNSRKESIVTFAWDENATNNYNPAKDARTLFSNTVTSTAIIYSPIDGNAASIRTIGNLDEVILLNIRTTYSGPLELKLNQVGSQFKVKLEDAVLKKTNDMNTSNYVFSSEGKDVNKRFYLHISHSPGGTGLEDVKANSILITAHDRKVSVTSNSEDPIQSVQMVDITGRALLKKTKINESEYKFDIPENVSLIIVSVTTDHSQKTEKIVTSSY